MTALQKDKSNPEDVKKKQILLYSVNKTDFNTKITDLGYKISNITGLLTNASFNSKVTEIENKISNITGLVAKTNFIRKVENRIPNVSNFDTKLNKIYNRVTSNKTTRVKTGKKLNQHIRSYTELIIKKAIVICKVISVIATGYSFSPDRMYYCGHDEYENYLAFPPMLHSLIQGNTTIASW